MNRKLLGIGLLFHVIYYVFALLSLGDYEYVGYGVSRNFAFWIYAMVMAVPVVILYCIAALRKYLKHKTRGGAWMLAVIAVSVPLFVFVGAAAGVVQSIVWNAYFLILLILQVISFFSPRRLPPDRQTSAPQEGAAAPPRANAAVVAAKRFFVYFWNFSGRATRGEFWCGFLFCVLMAACFVWKHRMGVSIALSMLIPFFAVCIRRLHDTGRSWEYLLWILVPIVGWVLLTLRLCRTGEGDNDWGPALESKTCPYQEERYEAKG